MTEPQPQVTVTYPAIPRPYKTVFRVGVGDGDKIVRPPLDEDDTQPPVVIVGDDTDVYTMAGPPPAEPPAGMEAGDAWIDVSSGDVYVYNP